MDFCKKIVLLIGIYSLLIDCSREPQYYYDQQTRLYWMHCPAGQEYTGMLCQGNAVTMHWDEGLRYCAGLDSAKGQWRLASRDELQNYYLHFGVLKMDIVNLYWSSSSPANRPDLAWFLVPKLNSTSTNLKELDGLILCVSS
ncbi:MAG: DUF1566 domain-containing protein [Methyloprofundus sp.]|nr:DUF1566 domain-containing protein [Methylococcales bacterium]